MPEPHPLLARRFVTRAFCPLGVGAILLTLAACGRGPKTAATATKVVAATPDPRQEALIERAVRDRLAEENRMTEQQLVNARAVASQRMVGRQMFMKLEDQYRQRLADSAGSEVAGVPTPPMLSAQAQGQGQPAVAPSATSAPQAPAPVETAATPDSKLQQPPVEDQADSMKGKTGEQPKPTPAPSPTAPVAPPNK